VVVAKKAAMKMTPRLRGDKPAVSSALEARWYNTVARESDDDHQIMLTRAAPW
jgi:hypothetical protein